MSKKFIIANWKMHLTKFEAENLLSRLDQSNNFFEIIICPPFSLLHLDILKNFKIAAQNISHLSADFGAYTGEISAKMIRDIGCEYVIIGHSERRQYFHEENNIIENKLSYALNHFLSPILCIGETLEQRQNNQIFDILNHQISVLDNLKNYKFNDNYIFIAYEPVWAIGSGLTPTNIEIEEIINYIQHYLTKKFNDSFAKNIKIVYGGSVNDKNFHQVLSLNNIDGLLIGSASLDSIKFNNIINNKIT